MSGRLLLIGMLAAAVIATPFALAQRGGGGGAGGGGGMQYQAPSKVDLFIDRLQLKDEQLAPVEKVLNDFVKQVAPLRTQIDQARTQITDLIISGSSQDEFKKAMDSLTTAEAQLTILEGKALAQVSALLTPKQRSKIASAFDLLTALLDPPGTAGRAGFGAGGRR